MDNSKIEKLFQNFINSTEYERIAQKSDFDLTEIKGKLSFDELLNLESLISQFGCQNEKFMFECGFTYAWKLFNECKENQEKIDNGHPLSTL